MILGNVTGFDVEGGELVAAPGAMAFPPCGFEVVHRLPVNAYPTISDYDLSPQCEHTETKKAYDAENG